MNSEVDERAEVPEEMMKEERGAVMWEIFCHKSHMYGTAEKREVGAIHVP
jgi:hypothetical protein